ncbi:unnamed protein product [Adineta steineri]|uniref:Uncharacterized protein n=2 Tax=Adineta steineri TaxID=433720 RepID=A0A819B153_9BILA|nr:unnamed protein product [Adineta steineri]CAF3795930.1 unnamed protein product [Adineta steineri]
MEAVFVRGALLVTNSITNITIGETCTLEKLELLVMLCPRLQHIEMGIAIKDIGPLLRFIVHDNNLNIRHLISFCFIDSNRYSFQHLTVLLNSKILFGKWKVLYVDKKSKLFLWT